MKSLRLKTKAYSELENDYQTWLKALGYSKTVVRNLPSQVREYLHWLESNGQSKKEQINESTAGAFMTYFKHRSHQKTGGGLSQSHINKQIYAINLLFDYLHLMGEITSKKKLNYEKKAALKNRVILTKSEVHQLYESCQNTALGQRDRAMLSIYYGCGLRRSEGENLETTDLLLERNLLYVKDGKNGWDRYVPLASGVKKDLETYLTGGRKLLASSSSPSNFFLSETGKKLTGLTLLRRLKDLTEKAGLNKNIGLHSLRHSIGTHLQSNGMKLEHVSLFLGHRSIDSSQIYTHLNEPTWKKC